MFHAILCLDRSKGTNRRLYSPETSENSVVSFNDGIFYVHEGFKYHHAEQAYLMLTYWTPGESSLLLANASHQVGVGGFVINDQMEVGIVCPVLIF
jgi:hypothetical protein